MIPAKADHHGAHGDHGENPEHCSVFLDYLPGATHAKANTWFPRRVAVLAVVQTRFSG